MAFQYKIGFIGGGNMANAIINGLVNCNVLTGDEILVADPYSTLIEKNVMKVTENDLAYEQCEFLVLSVKPQIFKLIKSDFINIKNKYVISIMAGISSQEIQSAMPCGVGVIRVMPNTPCKVGQGMTCIANNSVGEYANDMVNKMFGGISKIAYVNEELFHAVTSISGSGPAYVYMFIEALTKAGVEGGLNYDTAKTLATQTVLGAGEMVANDMNCDIQSMITAVCSKGGTTIEAVEVFKTQGLDKIVSNAVESCRNKSIELGKN